MFFLVNKPKWFTSFQVVNKFKNIFLDEKVWHAGTLDPMATWLLIIAVKRSSTKELWKLTGLDKTYITKIDFSIKTDTRDMDYHEKFEKYKIEKKDWKIYLKTGCWETKQAPSLKEVTDKISEIIGENLLPLTMFSAKKVKWKKLYELARKWEDLKLEKPMRLNSFKILKYEFPILELELDVWAWTYIRSIWHRIWEEFWLWWTLTYLHRKSIWPFKTSESPPKSLI